MKRSVKRLLSLVIVVAMALSMLPLISFAAGTTTVYCKTLDTWTLCNAYWWGSADTNPSWPGVPMTQDANGIWTYDVPSDATGLIFNNVVNSSGSQTNDLTVPTDGNVMYTYNTASWGPYDAVPVEISYYVAGTMNNWTNPDPAYMMEKQADGTYALTMTLEAGPHELKVTDGTWNNSWGEAGSTANYAFTAAEAGEYTVTFDGATVNVTGNLGEAEPMVIDYITLVGDEGLTGVEWDPADWTNVMIQDGQVYTITLKIAVGGTYDFKFAANGTWDLQWASGIEMISGETQDAWFNPQGNSSITVGDGATVILTLDLTNMDYFTGFGAACMAVIEGGEPIIVDPTDPLEIVDAAYALAEGESMTEAVTLTGEIISIDTAYSSQYSNITVTIVVDGCSAEKPIMCYRLKGTGADTLAVGDTITVTGTIKNYNGTIEFDTGCSLDSVVKGDSPVIVAPEDPLEIVDAAYALAEGESMAEACTLKGKIITIDTPYSSAYENISVTIVVEGCSAEKPIMCYRLAGTGADTLAVGDIITVSGTLTNYKGTIEFKQGCSLDFVVKGDGPVIEAPEDPLEIVDAAYALAVGATLPYEATLTGTITEIVEAYNEVYQNITVNMVVTGREDKPIRCYRMKVSDPALVAGLAVGDTVTVTGNLKNYAKTDSETGVTTNSIQFIPCSLDAVIKCFHEKVAYVAQVDVTCTEAGNIAHYACECGAVFEDAEASVELTKDDVTINHLGHDVVEGFCTRCGEYVDQIACPHSFTGPWVTVVEPTCVVNGRQVRSCYDCSLPAEGTVTDTDRLPSCTGEDYVNNMNKTFPTFTVAGASKLVLHFSDASLLEQDYDKLYIYSGDTVNESSLVGTYTGSLANRTVTVYSDSVTLVMVTDGVVTKHGFEITAVDYVYSGYRQTLNATGHSYDDGIETPPTCIEAGYITYTCLTCGATKQKNTDAPIAGHSYDSGVETLPTCTEAGYTTYTCIICGFAKTAQVDALGHEYASGFCSRCGKLEGEPEVEPESPFFWVTVKASKTTAKVGDVIDYTIYGYGNNLAAGEFRLTMPEGLKYVDGNSPGDLAYQVGWAAAEFTESSMMWTGYNDRGTRFPWNTVLMTFSAEVVAEGSWDVGLAEMFVGDDCYEELIPDVTIDTVTATATGGTLTGSVASVGEGTATLELVQNGQVIRTTNVSGAAGSYQLSDLLPGNYTLRVSKPNHVTREYPVTLMTEGTQDVELHLLGDANGDGMLTAGDVAMIYLHARKVGLLTDYSFLLGDINGDGRINMVDVSRIYAHVTKTNPLW